MRKLFFIPFIIGLLFSCNDGDIIVTSFNFNPENLDNCGGPGGYVFFNINNSATAESLSLSLSSSDILFLESGTEEYVLDGTSIIANYRKYDADISNNYFCNTIPPITPTVISEFIGDSGIAKLTTVATRNDNDGLEEEINTQDTDQDTLLDYYDEDDDGDNVPTLIELGTGFVNGEDEFPKDTDGDGIYDYLDDDDDNDNVLTRNEDTNGDLDPTNDIVNPETGPDYLNSKVANETIINEYRVHTYTLVSDISLIISNLVLVNGEETITQETMNFGNKNNVVDATILLTPDFN